MTGQTVMQSRNSWWRSRSHFYKRLEQYRKEVSYQINDMMISWNVNYIKEQGWCKDITMLEGIKNYENVISMTMSL